jgi:hypothetical protein
MIIGPISPTRFVPGSTKAPEPNLAVNTEWTTGQLLQCLQTGRLWTVGTVNNSQNQQVRQILPWVISTDGQTSTRTTNSSGALKIQVGQGGSLGSVNLFDSIFVNQDGVLTVAGTGVMVADSTGTVQYSPPINIVLEDSDELLSTSAAASVPLYMINSNAMGAVSLDGKYHIVGCLQFDHNNPYSVTMALEACNSANSQYYPIQVVHQSSQGGWMQLSLNQVHEFIAGTASFSSDSFRIRAFASVNGVYHKPYDTAGTPLWPTNVPGGYPSTNSRYRSSVTAQRVG